MEFKIPSSRDDLLGSSSANEYTVSEILTLRQVPIALQAFKSAWRGNPYSIKEHFDTLFSVLCLQKDLDMAVKEEAWLTLLKACQGFVSKLTSFVDGMELDREEVPNNLNTLKMSVYLLCQFMELFDSETIRPTALVTGKGRGKKAKALNTTLNMDWDYERQQGLKILLSIIQLPVYKLWDPPVVEEEFVSVVSVCCYKLLENPSLSKIKESLELVAHIIGNLVKRYNHGLGASLKIDQLLKHFEFLTIPLTQIVEIMVTEHGCKSTVADIIREIGNSSQETAKDSSAAKAYAGFLIELAERIPSVVLPCVALIVSLLEGESYTLRNGVLGMMANILIKHLCKDELDDKLRLTRDGFFEKLEDHIHDVNAFVRSKVLQIWLNIVSEQCLPLLQQESLMALVVGRLHDKSSIVRRHALQLLTALLKSNPFAAQLPVEDLRSNYEKERALLEEMKPTPVDETEPDNISREWVLLEDELMKAIEDISMSDEERQSPIIGDDDNSEEVLKQIVSLLEHKELDKAVCLTSVAKENFPDLAVFTTEVGKDGEEESVLNEENLDGKSRDILTMIKNIFMTIKKPPKSPECPDVDENLATEVTKQETLVQYLKNSLTFATQVQKCIPVICQLLGSKNSSDVLEGIQFFMTAFQFGVSQAQIGVRRMMVLIWSQEQTVREAVVEAYRVLYLEPKDKNQRSSAMSVVKSLTSLMIGSTVGELASLEALVSELVNRGYIGPKVVQALWESLTLKSGATAAQDSRAAVHLIAMCAQAEPDIVKTNIEVLVQEGLGERSEKDYLLAQGVCQALLTLAAKAKEKGKQATVFRLQADHDMFTRLTTILVKGICDASNPYWIPLGDQVVKLIYKLAETPDIVSAQLLKGLVKELRDLLILEADVGDAGSENTPPPGTVSSVLARICCLAGQVAFHQTVYLEVDVLTELKRRQAVIEETKEKGKSSRQKSKGPDSSKTAELEEDMALAGASAEDAEAECVRKLCEIELLSDENFLSAFPPILVAICSNTEKFGDHELQTAASLALARFMIISSEFCESHLQLLFTLLERSSSPVIRSNLIIALGDLTFRFPNLVEPWTAHLYARLRDNSPSVRKTTLQVLTHLILNDMVKVKGQISELATCIVDADERISGLAKLFFHELAKKGNSMYNMPDIISRLSDPEIGVEEDQFQIIIRYIFSHIEKSKHCESLAEKLCHRFRAVRTERQVRDLSFCLSQLSFTEKGVGKLMENFACFADKLVDDTVYGHFCQILGKCRQFAKPEAKAVLEDFEDKLQKAHTKGQDEKETDGKATTKSVCVKTTKAGAAKKTPGRKKPGISNKENEDYDSGEDTVRRKTRGGQARTGKDTKRKTQPKFVLESDDDDDDDLFSAGNDGSDSELAPVTSPPKSASKGRSRRGKVALSALQTKMP